MMNFTRDERNLMMLYSPGTRSGLCEALLQMKEQLSEEEAELCALADSVLNKLSGIHPTNHPEATRKGIWNDEFHTR